MKKIFVFIAALFFASPVFAHPPTDLKLSYTLETQTLRIEMTHTTSNMVKHYIRRLEISKNGEEPLAITIPKQTTPSGHTEELVFPAKPKDTISVKAYSTEGGIASAEIKIPEPFNPDSY